MLIVYRKKNPHQHSIENVFESIFGYLKFKNILDSKYIYLKGYRAFILDVFKLNFCNEKKIFITGDCNYIIPFLFKKNIILVIHDIGHYTLTLKGVKKYIYGLFWFYLPLKKVSKIICVSNATKINLQKHFKITKPIYVIDNPVSNEFYKIQEKRYSLNHFKILQVGTGPHKNIERLSQALRGLPISLNIIGTLNKNQTAALIKNNICYCSFYNIPFSELIELYSKADIIAVISLGEGFGLPLIEAQAAKRPVVVSNISPLSEIAGNINTKVDPYNVIEIRKMFLRLIFDYEFRQKQVFLGVENSKKFRISRISNMYFNIINS